MVFYRNTHHLFPVYRQILNPVVCFWEFLVRFLTKSTTKNKERLDFRLNSIINVTLRKLVGFGELLKFILVLVRMLSAILLNFASFE